MDEKMKELSQVLPSEIEARSFEIITCLLYTSRCV